MLVVVFTFLFIDMFDTVGTLVGVCTKAGMTDEKGNIHRIKQASSSSARIFLLKEEASVPDRNRMKR